MRDRRARAAVLAAARSARRSRPRAARRSRRASARDPRSADRSRSRAARPGRSSASHARSSARNAASSGVSRKSTAAMVVLVRASLRTSRLRGAEPRVVHGGAAQPTQKADRRFRQRQSRSQPLHGALNTLALPPRSSIGGRAQVRVRSPPHGRSTMPGTEREPQPSRGGGPDRERLEEALVEIKRVIAGQDEMLERVLVCLVAGGHLLIEGVPGLAKTLTIKTTAAVLGGTFRRVQFTPDLVPSDLVGTRILRPDAERLRHRAGAGVLQLPARGRDQPRTGEGAVGAARGDAGASGHDRPRHAPSSPTRSWSWRRRTRSSPRARTRCPRRRSIASCSRCSSTTPSGTRS